MTFWSHLGQALPLAGMAKKTLKTKLPNVLDLLLHSTVFVYFGPSIPWQSCKGNLGAGGLVACLVLILLSWRMPIGTGTEEIDLHHQNIERGTPCRRL